MWQDPDLWLVILSLATTAAGIALWLRDAGDDWLTLEPDYPLIESMRSRGTQDGESRR